MAIRIWLKLVVLSPTSFLRLGWCRTIVKIFQVVRKRKKIVNTDLAKKRCRLDALCNWEMFL